jgi:hypothetical protein
MKFLPLALAIVAVCSSGAAQQSKKPKAAKTHAALSESYARAALIALSAIKTDETVPHIDNGEPVGGKNTNAAIDAAGALGHASAEASTTEALHAIYRDKLLDNNRRDVKKTNYESDSGLEDEGTREMTASQEMLSDSELIEMDQKEKACFDAMDVMLRLGSSDLPPACLSWAPDLKALEQSK